MISPSELATLLLYNPKTGVLYWQARGDARWDARWAGKPALQCITPDTGYRVGSVRAKRTYAHRAAFALMTGRWPDEVDHINGKRDDNRWVNLREVSRKGQRRNMKLRADNKTGHMGVSQLANGRWRARIADANGEVQLGAFRSKGEAIAARKAAEKMLGYHENHGRKI